MKHAVVALLGAALTLPAAPVSAAAPVPLGGVQASATGSSVSAPRELVLYWTDSADDPAQVTVTAHLVAPRDVSEARLFVREPGADEPSSSGSLTLVSGTRRDGVWTGTLEFTRFARTGSYALIVEGLVPMDGSDDARVGDTATMQVRRNTDMPQFNARPEPVRAGDPVRVGGTLTRLDPVRGYVPYTGKTVHAYFKPVGGTWTYRGSAVTDASGRWSRTFTARVDGTWQARFAGTSNYDDQTSRSDFVDVR